MRKFHPECQVTQGLRPELLSCRSPYRLSKGKLSLSRRTSVGEEKTPLANLAGPTVLAGPTAILFFLSSRSPPGVSEGPRPGLGCGARAPRAELSDCPRVLSPDERPPEILQGGAYVVVERVVFFFSLRSDRLSSLPTVVYLRANFVFGEKVNTALILKERNTVGVFGAMEGQGMGHPASMVRRGGTARLFLLE